MSLVSLIVTLIAVGLLLWLINNYIPMDTKIKGILNIVVVAVAMWLLNLLGLMDSLRGVRVGRSSITPLQSLLSSPPLRGERSKPVAQQRHANHTHDGGDDVAEHDVAWLGQEAST